MSSSTIPVRLPQVTLTKPLLVTLDSGTAPRPRPVPTRRPKHRVVNLRLKRPSSHGGRVRSKTVNLPYQSLQVQAGPVESGL